MEKSLTKRVIWGSVIMVVTWLVFVLIFLRGNFTVANSLLSGVGSFCFSLPFFVEPFFDKHLVLNKINWVIGLMCFLFLLHNADKPFNLKYFIFLVLFFAAVFGSIEYVKNKVNKEKNKSTESPNCK